MAARLFWDSHLMLLTLSVTCVGLRAPASAGQVLRIETHGQDFPCTQPFQQLTDIEPLTSFLKLHCLPASVLFLPEAALLVQFTDKKDTLSPSTCLNTFQDVCAAGRFCSDGESSGLRSVWAALLVLTVSVEFCTFDQVIQPFVTEWCAKHFLWASCFWVMQMTCWFLKNRSRISLAHPRRQNLRQRCMHDSRWTLHNPFHHFPPVILKHFILLSSKNVLIQKKKKK